MLNSYSVIGLNCEGVIRDRVRSGYTHQAIASELQQFYPGLEGLSVRSVRQYCLENDIHYSSRLNDQEVDDLVEQAVFQVHFYICIIFTALCRWKTATKEATLFS